MERLRSLETERAKVQGELARLKSLLSAVTNSSRTELRRMGAAILPDPALLLRLQEEENLHEQKLAGLSVQFGADAPEMRAEKHMLKIIQSQIDERLDGLLAGMKIKLRTEEEQLRSLAAEIAESRREDISNSIAREPYLQARREIEQLRLLAERLQARLLQERMELRLGE